MCYVMMVTNVTNVAADRNHVTIVPSSGGRICGPEERSLRCREMGRDSQHCLMVTLDTSPPYIGWGVAGNLLHKEVNKDIRSGGTGDCWGWDHLRRDS